MQNYRFAVAVYCLFMLAVFRPYLMSGEVVAPRLQAFELGDMDAETNSASIENRKFSDFTKSYIPEIHEYIKGNRSGWLALWSDKNELGRPLYHLAGFSPAYFPSWLIVRLTDNPWRFITFLSLFTCFLGGLFLILFCREVGLHPLAGLIAGTGLAASPQFMYWLSFPMFISAWCWSAGALWGVTRLSKRTGLLAWSVLAFSGYSLLMTAYPQSVVFHAYLLGGYFIYLASHKIKQGTSITIRFSSIVASALFVGGLLALPVYRDLVYISSESGRISPAPSFFTDVLPGFSDSWDALVFFTLHTVPEIFGNPVAPEFPFSYDGLSISPLFIFFVLVGFFTAFKDTWGWWLAIVILSLFAFVHPLYVLGVEYLGFNLSRSNPLGIITLPFMAIVAFGADALVRRVNSEKMPGFVLWASLGALGVVGIAVLYGMSQNLPIRSEVAWVMLLMIAMLSAQYNRTRPVYLVLALAIFLMTVSYPLMLRQNMDSIVTTSPLVERIRRNLPEGSRYAVASPGISALPPNVNAGIGLPSVHTYNSLSPKRYHALIRSLGGEVMTYGRLNKFISPDYNSPVFWMSNIGLVLSPKKFVHQNLEYVGDESGVQIYRVISRMGRGLQVYSSWDDNDAEGLYMADPRLFRYNSPLELRDEGDLLEFEVIPGEASVLILSQKFHRDWHAMALSDGGWIAVRTVEVNGVFQGVLLPSSAGLVRLEFKPWVRYAWGAHVFWLVLLAVLVLTVWKKRKNYKL